MQQILTATVLLIASVSAVAMTVTEKSLDTEDHRPTDFQALEQFIRNRHEEIQGQNGQWLFQVGQVTVMVLADEQHNRMRIMSPVADAANLDPQILMTMLEANFDRALDARYAVWQGQVWSVYLHPLASLIEPQFHKAVDQVVQLRQTFGTTYSSSHIVFGQDP